MEEIFFGKDGLLISNTRRLEFPESTTYAYLPETKTDRGADNPFVVLLANVGIPAGNERLSPVRLSAFEKVEVAVPIGAYVFIFWKSPVPAAANKAPGEVVPTPTLPALVTTKLVAVEEPIANEGPTMPFGFIESCAHGDVVPIPTFPFPNTLKSVTFVELATAKSEVRPDD